MIVRRGEKLGKFRLDFLLLNTILEKLFRNTS